MTDDDARKLAEMEAPMPCYLSVYAEEDWNMGLFDQRIDSLLGEFQDEEDAVENLQRSAAKVRDYLEANPPEISSAVFSCWLDDYLEGFRLRGPVESQVILSRSPYILPLVNVLDEYETWCLVYLDHSSAGIYLVAGRKIGQVKTVHGDIKNHVKKGGFSQARYERRREKDILHYCREIADQLEALSQKKSFDRIIIVGDRTLIPELERELSPKLTEEVASTRAMQGTPDADELREMVQPLFTKAERSQEHELLDEIREERFRSGRASVGVEETLAALQEGRVQTLLLQRGADLPGYRCTGCGWAGAGEPTDCPACGGETVPVDLAEEMVELAERTSAGVELSEPMKRLTSWGEVAALLRY